MMARARNIKPAIMANEYLADLPAIDRLLFIYLWMLADREGRLEDRPRQIKALALPYDDLDADEALSRISRAGFIVRYKTDEGAFIQIVNFSKHQTPHPREQDSIIPACEEGQQVVENKEENKRSCQGSAKVRTSPSDVLIPDTRIPDTLIDDVLIPDTNTLCDGDIAPTRTEIVAATPKAPKQPAPTSLIWSAYSTAYADRYGVEPVRNAKVNGQLSQLLSRLGAEDAPAVAAWFIGHNDRWYVGKMHSVDCLLRDCEKLRTEWATGRTMTQRQANDADRRQSTGNMAASLADRLRAQGKLA